jgi:hypothetical protein
MIESWAYGRPQFVGVSPRPLLDACRQLKQSGLMDDTVVGLFDLGEANWLLRTTVGYGSRYMLHAGPYREFPGGPIKHPPSDDLPAKSEAPPPPPHTPPAPPVDTDLDPAEPKKKHQSHHRPKPKGSAARRGSR